MKAFWDIVEPAFSDLYLEQILLCRLEERNWDQVEVRKINWLRLNRQLEVRVQGLVRDVVLTVISDPD